MATVVESRAPAQSAPARAVVPEQRKARPVLWFAAVGVLFTGLMAYVLGSWLIDIINGSQKSIGTGVTPVPAYMRDFAVFQEIFFPIGMVALCWFFVVKPLRRDRRLSSDGMIWLAFLFAWWQDPVYSYFSDAFQYNAVFLNEGSWSSKIPGWSSPNPRYIAEPILWTFGFYLFLCAGGVILFSCGMRKARARWPQLGNIGLVLGCFVCAALADAILENTFLRFGSYTYAGTVESLTLWPSHFYRFPIYEAFTCGSLLTAWTCLHFFRDDKGHTLVDRGIDKVKAGTKTKTLLRFAAIVGMINIGFLVFYNIPNNLMNAHTGNWPKDVLQRSYFMQGLCGAGTQYACPSTDLPVQKGAGTVHIGPNGKLYVPAGAHLPTIVPLEH